MGVYKQGVMEKMSRKKRLGIILLVTFSVWIALMGAIVPYKDDHAEIQEVFIIRKIEKQNQEAEKLYMENKAREEEAERLEKQKKHEDLLALLEKKQWQREKAETEEAWEELQKANATMAEIESLLSAGFKGEYQEYAYSFFDEYGWTKNDFQCLIYLWERESNWNPDAHNGSSGAHGIPQSLPASKMASEGDDYYTNAETQIRWGIKYIASRYGTPAEAWAHSEAYNWY